MLPAFVLCWCYWKVDLTESNENGRILNAKIQKGSAWKLHVKHSDKQENKIWSDFILNHNFTSYPQWTKNASYASIRVYSAMLKQKVFRSLFELYFTGFFVTYLEFIYFILVCDNFQLTSEMGRCWNPL